MPNTTATVALALQDEVRILVSPATGRWKRVTSLSENFVSLDATAPVSRRTLEARIADGSIEHRSINALAAEQDAAIAAMNAADAVIDHQAPAPIPFGTMVRAARRMDHSGTGRGVVVSPNGPGVPMAQVHWEGSSTDYHYPHELEVIR